MKKLMAVLIGLLFIITLPPQSMGEEENGDAIWPIVCYDVRHTGLAPYDTETNPYEEIWRLPVEYMVDTGAAIAEDGTLYVGAFDGTAYAINPDGSIQWSYDTNKGFTTSTPCISEDGTIYMGTAEFHLYAFNPNGTVKWNANLHATLASSPAIANDGTIYIGTMTGVEIITYSLVAVAPNGSIKWWYETNNFITSDPAITTEGNIIFGSADRNIYALYPNGTLAWKHITGDLVKGPPSIDTEGNIYINSYDGYLYSLHPNGTLRWKTEIDGWYGTETNPSFGPDGTIYLVADGIAAINPNNGSTLWRYNFPESGEASWLSNPIVSADGIIYVGTTYDDTSGGTITALNPDGTLRFSKKLSDQAVYGTPSISSDGTVYITSSWYYGGAIHAFGEWTGNNHAPTDPVVSGKSKHIVWDNPYSLTLVSTDEDLHPMKYIIDWGDEETTETFEISSGYEYTVEHDYPKIPKTYTIQVTAVDSIGLESNLVEHTVQCKWFDSTNLGLDWLLNRFPFLTNLLERLGILTDDDTMDINEASLLEKNPFQIYERGTLNIRFL